MLTIDGRTGGGQLLRTGLSLSAIMATSFTLEDVRAGRPSPGLKPQHLAAVETMAALCDADVTGATHDSKELTFEPGRLTPTSQTVDIDTAGSIPLLFDAILPLSTAVDAAFEVTATGGTDVKWSPTIGYFGRIKLPLLGRSGLKSNVEVEQTGFYPVGGGRTTLCVEPSTLQPIELGDCGPLKTVSIYSKASAGLEDADVAVRQADRAAERLESADLTVDNVDVKYVESPSAGSSILLRAVYDRSIAGFDALGERGKPSETVANEAVDRFLTFHAGLGAVDHYMADQLLVYLALAGGGFSAPELTNHLESNIELITRFGFEIQVNELTDGTVLIES
jgi:RNA 3'-terminal phosphate cyclase (ATP)